MPETTDVVRRLAASFAAACALTILAVPAAQAADSPTSSPVSYTHLSDRVAWETTNGSSPLT